MSDKPTVSSIYLYKPPDNEDFTNSWVYYRIVSIRGPDEAAGKLNAPIQVCKVSWPSFTDIPPMTDTPGITGLTTAYQHMCQLVKSQWGVEHEQSVLIGLLVETTVT